MSILRTHNLQNPDSSTINIVMDQGGNTNIAGITTVGSDLNISDKIIHTGDTDTAIRFPADDTITAESGGSERVRITSGGLVGIGTTNPTAKLEVETSVDGESTLATFKNTSGGGTNETVDIKLGLENTIASNVILRAGKEANHSSGAATDNFFAIHTTENNTSAEKLRITSAGNIGIGTDNPLSKLHVYNDNIQISSDNSKGIDIFEYNSSSSSCGKLTFYRSNSSAIGVATTSVTNNEDLGSIDFRGWNSIDNAYQLGASIVAEVDGVADSNPTHMPGSLSFKLGGHVGGSTTPAQRFILRANGNASLSGGSPPDWKIDTGSSYRRTLNLGTSAFISGLEHTSNANTYLDLGTNSYYASDSNWKFLSNNYATRYQQGGLGYAGEHVFWRSTTSGPDDGNITWAPSFRIAENGQLGVSDGTGSNFGTAGQVLTSGGAAAAPSWSGGATRVLEYVSAPCNGQTVLTSHGSKTTQNVGTAGYQLTTSFALLVGSMITYRPPTGTTTVIYRYAFQCSHHDTIAIAHFRFYIGSNEVTYARYTIRGTGFQNRVVFEWPIKIGGTASAAIGQLASWNSDLTMKMEARDYSSSYDTKVNMTNNWDGGGTDQFSMPTISITALGS